MVVVVAAVAVAAVVSSAVTVVDVDAAVAAKPVAVLLAAATVSYNFTVSLERSSTNIHFQVVLAAALDSTPPTRRPSPPLAATKRHHLGATISSIPATATPFLPRTCHNFTDVLDRKLQKFIRV